MQITRNHIYIVNQGFIDILFFWLILRFPPILFLFHKPHTLTVFFEAQCSMNGPTVFFLLISFSPPTPLPSLPPADQDGPYLHRYSMTLGPPVVCQLHLMVSLKLPHFQFFPIMTLYP